MPPARSMYCSAWRIAPYSYVLDRRGVRSSGSGAPVASRSSAERASASSSEASETNESSSWYSSDAGLRGCAEECPTTEVPPWPEMPQSIAQVAPSQSRSKDTSSSSRVVSNSVLVGVARDSWKASKLGSLATTARVQRPSDGGRPRVTTRKKGAEPTRHGMRTRPPASSECTSRVILPMYHSPPPWCKARSSCCARKKDSSKQLTPQ